MGLLLYAGMLSRQLRPVTMNNIRTFSAGPSGLIKTFYIQSRQNYHLRRHSDTSRTYVGLTLSKYLYPANAINKASTVTFYALYSADKISVTHFAATAGNIPASAIRLYIDTLSYLMHAYYFLYFGMFLGFTLIKDIYQRIKGKADIESEVSNTYNASTVGKWHGRIWVLFLLFLLI
ncbi:hypothetical protein MUGA111182_09050 [Mucilaginibacter galii]|uniref:hypothetical protein n=1 Tax=Mucilaginibacter galii TaxID=2005073 RepID=UPI001E2E9CD0|nr:hypothetical protein [Mucilaginibacter galii]